MVRARGVVVWCIGIVGIDDCHQSPPVVETPRELLAGLMCTLPHLATSHAFRRIASGILKITVASSIDPI